MVDIFACLEGGEEVEEVLLFLLQVEFGLLLYLPHVGHIHTDPRSLYVSEDLSEGQPVLLV